MEPKKPPLPTGPSSIFPPFRQIHSFSPPEHAPIAPAAAPNKTWEGFIGAAGLTIAFGFLFPLCLPTADPLITDNPLPTDES